METVHVIMLMLLLIQPLSCKRKVAETPAKSDSSSPSTGFTQDQVDGKGKPDKVSEEPTGLPGYPLACRWVRAPANDALDAALDCFVADSNGQPLQLPKGPAWEVSYQGNAKLKLEPQSDQSVALTVNAKTRDEVGLALQNLQLRAQLPDRQTMAQGRELIKAEANRTRVAASCQTLFTLLLVNDAGQLSYIELNRFEGCEVLAAKLLNLIVPEPKYRGLVDTHKTVAASCSGTNINVTVTQAAFQGTSSQGPIDPASCQDLSALINSLGL